MNRRHFLGTLALLPLIRPASVLADAVITLPEAFIKVQTSSAIDRSEEKFLRSIAARETGLNPHAIGPEGERSMYQMKYATWKRYTSLPFHYATSDPILAHNIALRHLHHLRDDLHFKSDFYLMFSNHSGVQHRAIYKLALMWHYGELGSWWVEEHGSNDEYALAVERLFLS